MTPFRQQPYTRADLQPLYAPRSIALVGASPRAGSFGERTQANLRSFTGALYPVNARYPEINGVPCHASLQGLPEVPDLVILAVPAAAVEGVVDECIALGVPSALIYASGFAETAAAADIVAQQRMLAKARAAGMKLLGPNCVGLLNYVIGARATFAGVPEGKADGRAAIGLISQSGAMGFALAQAMDRGVAISHVLSCGNSADVDVADWIQALADDPDCAVIACAFEGMQDATRFRQAARYAWARDKPLIVFKLATGTEGAAAAMSHTGSLAGSNAQWNAVFEDTGAVVVQDFEDLMETAAFFAKTRAATAPGVAVLAGSGGAAIIAADCAEEAGVPLPQPSPDAERALRAAIPPFVQPRNPCDVTAQVINDKQALLASADALLGDPAYGALIFCQAYAYDTATARLPDLSALSARHDKPVLIAWLTQHLEGPGTIEAEKDPHLVVFRSMRRCFQALDAWHQRAERRARKDAPEPAVEIDITGIGALLDAAGPGQLGESDSARILSLCSIGGPKGWMLSTEDEAAEAAEAIGGALALKIDSADIAHKTEAGGVMLGVDGPDAARAAFRQIMQRGRAAHPQARINGVNVQQMIPPGLEVIVGFRHVPGFDPAITIGLGGVLTELLRDTVTVLAPVTPAEARRHLRRLRGAALFDGFRNAPAVDLDALARAVSALSQVAATFAGRIHEFEVNPLICLPDRIVAVDALAVLGDACTAEDIGNDLELQGSDAL